MEKTNLHPRNKHRARYDFDALCAINTQLKKYLIKNKYNNEATIDFSNPLSVKTLNQAILKLHYQIEFWDIPKDFLCPPIPGRADYIHYAADLLKRPYRDESLKILDIGCGANCVYPLVGNREYGWKFVGSDIDETSLESAKKIVRENKLEADIEIRKQNSPDSIFHGIIKEDDRFDLSLCNPPFHRSKEEAQKGTRTKNRNLNTKLQLNFGGQSNELWCLGGESDFIKRMALESIFYKDQCTWFTSLVSSKENLSSIYGELKRIKALRVETIEMSQGQKISRFVAWTFKEV